MLESLLDTMGDGIKLLEQGKYSEAINFFSGKVENKDDYISPYGLATAMFKMEQEGLTKERTEEIIKLYGISIQRKKDFADAYFMKGMAYEQLASIFTREFKKDPYHNQDEKIKDIKNALTIAKKQIKKAVELNPKFKEHAESELRAYKDRLEGIENLRALFNKERQ